MVAVKNFQTTLFVILRSESLLIWNPAFNLLQFLFRLLAYRGPKYIDDIKKAKAPKDSKRIKKIQKNPKDSKEGKYRCKALNRSSWMAKKANIPPSLKFKELDAPALLGCLKMHDLVLRKLIIASESIIKH